MRVRVRRGGGMVYRVRAELQDLLPTVWRRLEVSGRGSLREVDEVVETAFLPGVGGYRFVIDGVHYHDAGDAPPPGRCADDVSLETLALHVGARIMLTVDGVTEPWRYVLTVEEVAPRCVGQRVPLCTAGSGALPEFADGPSDGARLLESWRDPGLMNDQYAAAPPPPGFDPHYVDFTAINAALGRVPRHRPAS